MSGGSYYMWVLKTSMQVQYIKLAIEQYFNIWFCIIKNALLIYLKFNNLMVKYYDN